MIELWGKTKAGKQRGLIMILWLQEDRFLFSCLLFYIVIQFEHSRSFPSILEKSVCASIQGSRFFHHLDLCTLKVSCYLNGCKPGMGPGIGRGKSMEKAFPYLNPRCLCKRSIANPSLLQTLFWQLLRHDIMSYGKRDWEVYSFGLERYWTAICS